MSCNFKNNKISFKVIMLFTGKFVFFEKRDVEVSFTAKSNFSSLSTAITTPRILAFVFLICKIASSFVKPVVSTSSIKTTLSFSSVGFPKKIPLSPWSFFLFLWKNN